MRGEYKVPGGKLVAVDVEVADGVIKRAFVHGDFFLEPDEALEDLNAALVGMVKCEGGYTPMDHPDHSEELKVGAGWASALAQHLFGRTAACWRWCTVLGGRVQARLAGWRAGRAGRWARRPA